VRRRRRPGWYADPTERHAFRFWTGRHWTSDVANATEPPPFDPRSAPERSVGRRHGRWLVVLAVLAVVSFGAVAFAAARSGDRRDEPTVAAVRHEPTSTTTTSLPLATSTSRLPVIPSTTAAPRPIWLTSRTVLTQALERAAYRLIGRGAVAANDVDEFVAGFHETERVAQLAWHAGEETFDPPTPDVAAEDFIRTRYRDDVAAYAVVRRAQAFMWWWWCPLTPGR
jgi:hypothetical protein